MKFLFATALLLLAVFGSTPKANRLIPKEKVGGTLEANRLISKQVEKDLLLEKQEAVELRNNLNNFYEHKKVNNKENLKDSYLTPTHSISKSPRSTDSKSTAGSSSKTMNIKAKKEWGKYLEP